jgi:hypothetical protein
MDVKFVISALKKPVFKIPRIKSLKRIFGLEKDDTKRNLRQVTS